MSPRRRKTAALEHWLERAATPVFVVDHERRLLAFNSGCEALTGWSAAEVVGQTCHYGSVADGAVAAALTASLCPPPEAFAGEVLAAPAYVSLRSGDALPRLLHFFPVRDERERVLGVLGIIQPLPSPGPAETISAARRLHAELAALRMSLRGRFGPHTLVAKGVAMRKVLVQVGLAQQSTTPVLLTGEAGTGREHLARVIHFGGPNPAQWFVPLDCRRLGPEELDRVWTRLIDLHTPRSSSPGGPQPGTVYLSDVESLSRDLQERLVNAFSTGESRSSLPLRLLCSATRDLHGAVADQALRSDFAALISPLMIELPPLRERGGDLPLLAQHFLEDLNRQESKQAGGFDDAVWPLLLRYDWPGNLDELLAVVREARTHAVDPLIRVADLPFRFRMALEAQQTPPPAAAPTLPLDALLTKVETRLIALALERTKNNKSKAAELLGIHRARLIRRIEQLELEKGRTAPEMSEPLEDLAAELLRDDPAPE